MADRNHEKGAMMLGSVASGVMIGIAGAIVTWSSGHPAFAVLLAYATIGSLGTFCVAALSMGSPARNL